MAVEPAAAPAAPAEPAPATSQPAEAVPTPPDTKAAPPPQADPAVLENARGLLAERQAAEAYRMLAPREREWAGDKEYDYLLGVAAVDSGRPSEAVIALQRSLAMAPDYSAAQLELARAYYLLGDFEAARTEFEHLLEQEPPEEARKIIEDYLAAMERKSVKPQPKLRTYFEIEAGYDTNANGATEIESFDLFNSLGQPVTVNLNERNIEQSSSFAGIGYGVIDTIPLSARLSLDTALTGSHRRNFDASFVNTDRATLSSSLTWRRGSTRIQGGVGYLVTKLDSDWPFDGELNQHGPYVELGLRQGLTETMSMSAAVRGAGYRYEDKQEIRDVDQVLGSIGLERSGLGPRQARVGLLLIGGQDDAIEETSPYGRDITGARLSGSILATERLRIYGYVGVLRSEYEGLFFGEEREDTQTIAGLSTSLRFRESQWMLIPRVGYVRNKTDIELFDYDRVEVALALRRWWE